MSEHFPRPRRSHGLSAAKLYELAVAKDVANLIDLDAAMALSRVAIKAAIAMSPESARQVAAWGEEEIERLSMNCDEHSIETMALIRDAVSPHSA